MESRDGDKKEIWRKVYEFVATLDDEGFELMNFGYEGPEPEADRRGGEGELGAHRMYRHVAGRADLKGRSVLEVGCGRGGGAAFTLSRFGPRRLCGLDYSQRAIDICRQRYAGREGLDFMCGDAEDLPFPAGQFDAVINIESSHCYASLPRFFDEVWRVLAPGGDFLYADLFPKPEEAKDQLRRTGFAFLQEEEITSCVLRSLDKDHDRKAKLFAHLSQPRRGYMENWAGLRGSPVYEAFRAGEYRYLSFHLRKPIPP